MSKSIQLKNINNEKIYPHPYYPVGSIYISVNNTNPSQWFGGKWEQIAKGRTLVGVDTNDTDFNTVKKTGGEKNHTLTVTEMPSHNHEIVSTSGSDRGLALYPFSMIQQNYRTTDDNVCRTTGGDQPHNNLQPYFTCYIWCRTA